jgi:hypothetical protein
MRKLVIFLAAIFVILGADTVYASIPGSDGIIHGCYDNARAIISIIDSTLSCPLNETTLNWSQSSPPAATSATSSGLVVTASAWTTIRSVSVTMLATHNVLISFALDDPCTSFIRITVDSVTLEQVTDNNAHLVSFQWSDSLTSGSHTVTLDVDCTAGNRTFNDRSLTVQDLGS